MWHTGSNFFLSSVAANIGYTRYVSAICQLHPLGKFDESIMRSMCSFEPNAKGYSDLYETVLIDTPIGTRS